MTVRYQAGKNGYRVISDSRVRKTETTKPQSSNEEWVQSILSRTTRRPAPPTQPPTTTAPPPTTTSAPVLTRELQLQLQKLLARKNIPEQSRSRSPQEYFKRHQSVKAPNLYNFQQSLTTRPTYKLYSRFLLNQHFPLNSKSLINRNSRLNSNLHLNSNPHINNNSPDRNKEFQPISLNRQY